MTSNDSAAWYSLPTIRSSAPPSPSIIIFFCLFFCTFPAPFFYHHFLFPLLLHFSSTFLLSSFLFIYNCHYPFFFLKWHFELFGLIGLPVVAQRQTLYICSVEPAQAAATNVSSFSLLEMILLVCHAYSALSAS